MFIFRKPMVNFLLPFTRDLLEQTESENSDLFSPCRWVWILTRVKPQLLGARFSGFLINTYLF